MKKVTLFTAIFMLMLFGLAMARNAPVMKLSRFDVALVNLETPAVRMIAGEKATYKQAYLVRLRGEFPKNTDNLLQVYFGDKRIEEFGSLPDGLYFMVFTKAELDALAGKQIGFRFGDDMMTWSGTTFTPEQFAPFTAIPEREAFVRE